MLTREQSDALIIAELQQKNTALTEENLRLTNELSEVNDLCQSVIHDAKVKEEIHSRE